MVAERKRAVPGLASAWLVGPTLGGNLLRAREHVRQLPDLAGWVDYGAFSPPRPVPWNDDSAHLIATTGAVFPGRRLLAPQAGYSTATVGGVSELVQAKYVVRVLLAHFEAGLRRTHIATLVDTSVDTSRYDSNFGLVRNDFSPKPAFAALARLIADNAEPGALFETRPLSVHIDDPPPTLHRLLLSSRDGTQRLVLWLEQPSDDADAVAEVTLRLPPDVAEVRSWQLPEAGPAFVRATTAGTLVVPVSDRATFFAFRSGCAAAP
jgi:hypothetical protein